MVQILIDIECNQKDDGDTDRHGFDDGNQFIDTRRCEPRLVQSEETEQNDPIDGHDQGQKHILYKIPFDEESEASPEPYPDNKAQAEHREIA